MKRVMAVILSATTIFGTFPVGVNASVVEKAEGNVATFTSSGEGNNIKSDNDYNSQELLVATNEDFANLEGMLESIYSIKDKDFDSSTAKFEYVFYPFITQGYSSCGYEYFFGEDGEELNYTFNGETAKPDPKNRLYFGYSNDKEYYYYKLDADNVDWISKNIYNVEPNHSLDVYGDMGMYYYDGDYYIKSGDAGYIGHTADILDYKKLDNGQYYVTIQYSMEYDGINKNYMLVGLKNINGKKYWSVYKNSLNPFECDDIKPITVTLNGNKLTFSENQYIESGTTMVPMRAIFEALGASVDYDTETKTITATKGSTVIKLFANSDTATVNGKEVTLTSPVANKNGTTMVPLRLVSEALGAEVSWDAETKVVTINLDEEVTDKMVFSSNDTSLSFKVGEDIIIGVGLDKDNVTDEELNNIKISMDDRYSVVPYDSKIVDNKKYFYFKANTEGDYSIYAENSKTGEIVEIPLSINKNKTYNIGSVPTQKEDGEDVIVNNFSGMTIDNYKEEKLKNGSCNVSFDVYNTKSVYSEVEVYDSNGKIISAKSIEKTVIVLQV